MLFPFLFYNKVLMRRLIVVGLFFLTLTISTSVFAATFDPSSDWQTIASEHFHVHYPKRIEDVAKRSIEILEEIHPKVTARWDFKPWSYTEVVLVDNTDESNGFSTVLPYNWMLIFAVPPEPDSSLAHYDDWLRTLLIHEYTHIVQLDAYSGAWYPFRIVLGKIVAPSGVDPVWMREGFAQYEETALTAGGRGRGSYSEMVVRTSVIENDFPTIDEADGLGWRWPGFKGAYIYGLKFLQWLSDTYGEDKLMKFDRRVRSSIMLTMINHQARNVYGKTFYELWREWKKVLEDRYTKELEAIKVNGLTRVEPFFESKRDDQLSAPTISKLGDKIIYTVTSPHTKTRIRLRDIETGKTKDLKKGQDGSQYSWSADGTKIVYSAQGGHQKYYIYNDLWLYDFDKDKISRLTKGMRARDPDFVPDGKSVIFIVSGGGKETIQKLNIETKEALILTSEENAYAVRFANPRVSPDGKYIVVSVWRVGHGWRIYRYDIDGKNPTRLTKGDNLVIEAHPVWMADGLSVIYSSDESGISNLYQVSLDGGDAKKITNVLTGVFQPSVSNDGRIVAQYYSVKGFGIGKVDAGIQSVSKKTGSPTKALGDDKLTSEAMDLKTTDTSLDLKGQKYVAFGHSLFLPRYLAPGALYVGDVFFASLSTGGADALKWQNWVASVNYRTDANFVGYTLQYWYNRYRPVFGALLTEYAVNFGDFTFLYPGGVTNTVHYFEKRRGVAVYAAVPLGHHSFSVAYYFEDHTPKTNLTAAEKATFNLGYFSGFRGEYRYGDSEMYPASISRENGRNIRLTGTMTAQALGSGPRNEQTIFSGDWREYIRLIGHHVLALRAGGGMTWGDRFVQGTFGLGGALGEGSFGGAGSYNYYPFRGLPVSAFSKTRVMLFSGEYRFPIVEPLHGLGTLPVFLKDLSGAFFSDYGNAWNAGESGSTAFSTFFDQFLLSVGSELRADFIVGHALPIHGRLGYAIVVSNRSRLGTLTDPILGDSIKNGMLVLTLGTSF